MFCLLLLVRGLLWGAPTPKATDPSHRIDSTRGVVQLTGRVLADGRRFEQGCSALLAVDSIDADRHPGRTELQLNPCPALPLQGWMV